MSDRQSLRDDAGQTPSPSPARWAWAPWRRAASSAARRRQQHLLAGFGRHALEAGSIEPLLDEATVIAAACLRDGRASILEHSPEEALFSVRASAGWGRAAHQGLRVVADPQSVAGQALQTGGPSIWPHPPGGGAAHRARLWDEHGIRSAICVPIGGHQGVTFGVLEVCTPDERSFAKDDVAYLQSLADMLAAAIGGQRQRQVSAGELTAATSKLRQAEEELLAKDLLVQEAHHRVANSLQLLGSLLHAQARRADAEARRQIEGAVRRIAAVGILHRRMCETGAGLEADAKDYLTGMLDEMRAILPADDDRALSLQMEAFMLATGDATAMGLITGELVTNAIKYGHGRVSVHVRQEAYGLEISVSDDGGGFPPDFDLKTSGGLGMRLVIALAKSTGGDVAAVDRSVSYGRIVVKTGFGGTARR